MKVKEVLQQAEIIYSSSYSNSFYVISKYKVTKPVSQSKVLGLLCIYYLTLVWSESQYGESEYNQNKFCPHRGEGRGIGP